MKYIRNAKVVLENGILWDGAVITDGDRIKAFGHENALPVPEGAEVVDAQGAYVGPGFVDIHVHGGDGKFLYQNPKGAVRHFLKNGETTVLAALYYDISKEEFLAAVDRVKEAMAGVSGPQELYYTPFSAHSIAKTVFETATYSFPPLLHKYLW